MLYLSNASSGKFQQLIVVYKDLQSPLYNLGRVKMYVKHGVAGSHPDFPLSQRWPLNSCQIKYQHLRTIVMPYIMGPALNEMVQFLPCGLHRKYWQEYP